MKYVFSSDKVTIFSYFVMIIVLGSIFLFLPISWNGSTRLNYIDALFTATSAVCVTGLASVDTTTYSLFGQVVIMLLIQFGGLGIVSFATIYVAIPMRKVSLVNRGIIKEMYVNEVESNPKSIIKNILLVTLIAEFAGFTLLVWRFTVHGIDKPVFTAMFHSVSAFCNAGFSTVANNLESFVDDAWINIIIMLLIIFGGLGFVVIQDIGKVITKAKRRFTYHTRIVLGMTFFLVFAGGIIFYLLEKDIAYKALTQPQKILAAFFQSVTTRTAGFDTVAQSALTAPSVFITLFLMFTGGSPGSTAGGVKTTTIFLTFVSAIRGYEDDGSIKYNRGGLSPSSVAKALSILAKSVLIIFIAIILLLILENNKLPFIDIVFEAISAFGTTGLSRGITGNLGIISKLIIIMLMFMGRVGLFAMAINKSANSIERFVEYPNENLLLG